MSGMTKALLVTGGMGFIGTNFVERMLPRHDCYHIINLDKLTYAAQRDLAVDPTFSDRYTLVEGCITDRGLVERLFDDYDIRGVIHFAAESHVDNSIANPAVFMETNVLGTFTLVHAAWKHWMDGPGRVKPGYESCRFHHISTDEVYGALGETGMFSEGSCLAPNSPYSASKASSDLVVRSYHRTYGLNVVTTHCSNNYGPRQHPEKLIPTIIRSALAGRPIPIYGTGKNVRDWLHVEDHVDAIDLVFHQGVAGETYNIGSDNEWSNIEIAREICRILDDVAADALRAHGLESFAQLIRFVADRPGHDNRYAVDATKLRQQLGWQPKVSFAEGLRRTVAWYVQKFRVPA